MKYLLPFALLLLMPACMTLSNNPGFKSADVPVAVELVSVNFTADKMNVFYIGVDNPVSVFVPGVRSDKVELSIENGTFRKSRASHYVINVSNPGEVKVTVKASDENSDIKSTFLFRAKSIPSPVPALDWYSKYNYTAGEFRQKQGLLMTLKDFDFDAKCLTVGYTLTRISQNGERQTALNEGARYGETAQALVNQAESGDAFIFSEIKTLCPGDTTVRQLNNVAYFIQ